MDILVIIALIYWSNWAKVWDDWDDTDQPKGTKNRKASRLNIFYDYGTGLQYLSTPYGGITPRLDADGKHMKIPEETT